MPTPSFYLPLPLGVCSFYCIQPKALCGLKIRFDSLNLCAIVGQGRYNCSAGASALQNKPTAKCRLVSIKMNKSYRPKDVNICEQDYKSDKKLNTFRSLRCAAIISVVVWFCLYTFEDRVSEVHDIVYCI